MAFDKFGQAVYTQSELCDMLYINPDIDISKCAVSEAAEFNTAVKELSADLPLLQFYNMQTGAISEFDATNQANWFMPDNYKNLDIVEWIIALCTTEKQLLRVEEELFLYAEFNLINVLRFIKYLVDTFRKNDIVLGVGRGSSVASYVLYLIGAHKIDSMKFELNINEFLKSK